jgi:hypothetical protein
MGIAAITHPHFPHCLFRSYLQHYVNAEDAVGCRSAIKQWKQCRQKLSKKTATVDFELLRHLHLFQFSHCDMQSSKFERSAQHYDAKQIDGVAADPQTVE